MIKTAVHYNLNKTWFGEKKLAFAIYIPLPTKRTYGINLKKIVSGLQPISRNVRINPFSS